MVTQTNPANAPQVTERVRIPMSVPSRKLEVPPIPGFHLYWFLESNVPRAIQGGYEFVNDKEVTLNQLNVATDRSISGNAAMGSKVMVVGGTSESGGAEHLVLMKIRQEWYDEDKKVIEERNASIMQSIFRGETVPGSERASQADRDQMYTRAEDLPLFNRPARKGSK